MSKSMANVVICTKKNVCQAKKSTSHESVGWFPLPVLRTLPDTHTQTAGWYFICFAFVLLAYSLHLISHNRAQNMVLKGIVRIFAITGVTCDDGMLYTITTLNQAKKEKQNNIYFHPFQALPFVILPLLLPFLRNAAAKKHTLLALALYRQHAGA